MRLCCSLILAAQALAFQTPPSSGVIEGRVIDSASGEPIAKSSVTLRQIPIIMGIRPNSGVLGGDFYDPSQMPATRVGNSPPTILVTDATGSFRAVVPAGRYQIHADRNGYVPVPAGVTALSLIPGETLKNVALKLNKHAIITGRIVDAEGEPLANVRVQCLRWTTGQFGQRVLTPQSSTITNDLGEYRAFGITPGQYILSAEAPANRQRTANRTAYVTLYAPGVPDLAGAETFDITSGLTRSGVDFRMKRVPVVEVRGKVTGAGASRGLTLALLPRDPALQMAMGWQHTTQVNPDGTFLLSNVPPGKHILNISGVGPNQERLSGRINLEVVDQDLAALSVSVQTGVSLKGQIRAEEDPPLENITLYFQPMAVSFSGGANGHVAAGGRFTVASLEPEIYRVQAYGLPPGYYLKSIKMGAVEATDELDLTGGVTGEVTITLEAGTAELNGKVLEKNQKPVSDVQVMVVNARGQTVRSTTTLIDGQYRLTELPPGDYRVFPVIDADISDPATLKRLAAAAQSITLARDARETLHLLVR